MTDLTKEDIKEIIKQEILSSLSVQISYNIWKEKITVRLMYNNEEISSDIDDLPDLG